LSHLPEDEARDLIMTSDRRPLTTKTITDPDEIMALIRKSSDDGFSLADEEGQMGIITVGSAILDGSGYPVAAVNMAASARSWSVDQVREKLGPLVMETARHISRTQGFSASYHES
jgi:IclR family pca regulon transcriptional regulator